uniref:BTB domain-containing protein n=1 Tax=Panagrolaimus sp. ES5 TaxID=591445 RepID=A0AC34FZE6_9BILA
MFDRPSNLFGIETKEELNMTVNNIFTIPLCNKRVDVNEDPICERGDKDFVIVVGDKELKLHKNVINAESSVFETMIQSGLQELKKNKVTITDFDFITVESAVKNTVMVLKNL